MKRKSNSLLVFRNCLFFVLYVIGLAVTLVSVDNVNVLTTFSMNGANSIYSTELSKHYVKKEEKAPVVPTTLKYRLTSFYTDDGYGTGSCTGSGLCTRHFKVNDKGWYTHNGKLVLAAATPYLQKKFGYKPGKAYFRYNDEVMVTIDGVKYPGIILDTCGACYKDERIDLFVKDKASVVDRGYRGKNMITVEIIKKQ